jgi:hypothetical protein
LHGTGLALGHDISARQCGIKGARPAGVSEIAQQQRAQAFVITATDRAALPTSGIHAGDQLIQDRGQRVQLHQVGRSEIVQDALAAGGEPDADKPAVVGIGDPPHEAGCRGTVDKLDRAVMPQQEVGGEVPDGRRLAARMALDRDQELMLDMSQPGRGARRQAAPPRGSCGRLDLSVSTAFRSCPARREGTMR